MICRECIHWSAMCYYFEDPLEPDDFGVCLICRQSGEEYVADDNDACECFKIQSYLEDPEDPEDPEDSK